MVAQFAIGLAADYGRTVIVPMTLVNPQYGNEIFAPIKASGQPLLHVFLDVPAEELKRRINTQILVDDDPAADAEARAFRLDNVDRCVAARNGLPDDTLVLRRDQHTPSELADLVLAHSASGLLPSMGEAADGVGGGSCPAAVRVVAITMLKADARARLSQKARTRFRRGRPPKGAALDRHRHRSGGERPDDLRTQAPVPQGSGSADRS